MFFRCLAIALAVCLSPSFSAHAADIAAPANDPADPFASAESPPAEPAPAPEPPAEPTPAPAPDWASLMGKPVILVTGGREMRGRLVEQTADTVTLKEKNGAVSDLPKAGVTEVREDVVARKNDPSLDDAPKRRSETARAARRAERAEDEAGSFHDRGAYLLVSPGFVTVPFRAPGAVFYRWGVGIGGVIPSQSSSFVGAYGFMFEHMTNKQSIAQLDVQDPFTDPKKVDYRTHIFRALAEVRLGSGSDKLFGYVLLGTGFSVLVVRGPSSSSLNDAAFGFAVPIGAGIQGMIGDHFLLGFEPRAVFDLFLGSGAAASFDARVVLGAKF